MEINGKHTSHHRFILQDLLSLSEVDLSRAAYGHLLLDNRPLDQSGVVLRLERLRRLVLWTLPSIVAFFATLETSTKLVSLPLTRQNLLSLRLLLHLLSRLTILGGRCLISLLRLTGWLSTRRVIGHPLDNLYLLSLWVTRRSSDHPLALPLSLSHVEVLP